MADTVPEGQYGVYSEPRDHFGYSRFINSIPLTYDEAIDLADKMCRANKRWHYYAKPMPKI